MDGEKDYCVNIPKIKGDFFLFNLLPKKLNMVSHSHEGSPLALDIKK